MYPSSSESEKVSAYPSRLFSLAEIQSATKDFDDELVIGQGGFGKVYKGQISSEEGDLVVAIKRLDSMSSQGKLEFRAEIETLSKLRHCHLVSLIGYCDDNKEMILVYEYMPNGTLDHHLHKAETPLSWVQRIKIAIGAGRGLDYLHTGVGTRHGIIHRDVKSSNILLDENWEARISDFGLSRIGPTNQSSSYVDTSIKGTFGYFDPEYFYTSRLTRKTDVFAFGVVLFELLSGRLPVDMQYGEENCSLVRWAQKCVKERKVYQMVDSNIVGKIFPKCLRKFTQIAYDCLHSDPKERPTMAEVVVSLQGLLELQQKHDNSANSLGSNMGFTWKIHKYFTLMTKENPDRSTSSSAIIDDGDQGEMPLQDGGDHGEMPHQDDGDQCEMPNQDGGDQGEMPHQDGGDHGEMPHQDDGDQCEMPNQDGGDQGEMPHQDDGDQGKMPNQDGGDQGEMPHQEGERPHQHGELVARDLKIFNCDELEDASMDFRKARLGKWDNGAVYKGWVDKLTYSPCKHDTGLPIAIKRLDSNDRSYLDMLKEFCHPNIVKLVGYCIEEEQLFVVHEFMSKGNLEDLLSSGDLRELPLVTKVKIVVGIAQAFLFMHKTPNEARARFRDKTQKEARNILSGCRGRGAFLGVPYLHRHHILLDENFTPKLSYYYISKWGYGFDPTGNDFDHDDAKYVFGNYSDHDDAYLKLWNDHHPGAESIILLCNLYGFRVVLTEVLTGRPIKTFDYLVRMDATGYFNGLARTCLEMCSEVNAESKMLKFLKKSVRKSGQLHIDSWKCRNVILDTCF